MTNVFSLFHSLIPGYVVLGVISLLASVAGIAFAIYSGIEMIREDNTTVGAIVLILGIIGIFFPLCTWIALIIAGVEYFKSNDRKKGVEALALGIASAVFSIIMAAVVLYSTAGITLKVLEQPDNYLTESQTDNDTGFSYNKTFTQHDSVAYQITGEQGGLFGIEESSGKGIGLKGGEFHSLRKGYWIFYDKNSKEFSVKLI